MTDNLQRVSISQLGASLAEVDELLSNLVSQKEVIEARIMGAIAAKKAIWQQIAEIASNNLQTYKVPTDGSSSTN